jgi:hypothetical protein
MFKNELLGARELILGMELTIKENIPLMAFTL